MSSKKSKYKEHTKKAVQEYARFLQHLRETQISQEVKKDLEEQLNSLIDSSELKHQ